MASLKTQFCTTEPPNSKLLTYYDCREMTENNLYALNQVPNVVLLLRTSKSVKIFRHEINATVRRIRHHSEQWDRGFGDDSSMNAHHAGITTDWFITACQGRTIKNFNFYPHSKIFSKTENFLLDNTLYLEMKLTNLADPEGATPSSSNSWCFYRTPQSFFYPFNPGELSRYS